MSPDVTWRSSGARGLTAQEAAARLAAEGPNLLPRPESRNFVRIALEILREPMFALLLGAGAIYLLLGDLNEWRPGIASSLSVLEPFFGPFGQPRPSFPSRLPFLALDQILGYPRGLVSELEVHDTPLARLASDHLPLRARIDLAGAHMAFQALVAAA